MILNEIFNHKKTTNLIGLDNEFILLKNLLNQNKMPKILLLSGRKGIGKSTLINHLLHYYYDKNNYDEKNLTIINKSLFNNQFINNLYPNIVYLDGSEYKNISIEEIRNLKNILLKSSFNTDKRFIILNNIEAFNISCVNALLKILEEPGKTNYFILINNQTKSIIETVKSRCLEIKILLTDNSRIKIILYLMKNFSQDIILDYNLLKISPGNYLKFNYIFNEKKIDIEDDFIVNLAKLLKIFKKEKDLFFKDFIKFYAEYYFQKKISKSINNAKYFKKRSLILKNVNDFFTYNLSQNTLLSSVENQLINE